MIRECRKNLEKKGYTVSVFETGALAAAYLCGQVKGKTVGFGDSQSLELLNLYDLLAKENQVFDPAHLQDGDDFLQAARKTLLTDVFFTSVNGVAASGELVNIDGTGNRVAGSLFGHEKVYFVIGRNKIVPTLEEAVARARNVAAPQNARRLGTATPCAAAGDRCYDCNSPDRICCAMTIHYRRMRHIEMEVVIINEDLGL